MVRVNHMAVVCAAIAASVILQALPSDAAQLRALAQRDRVKVFYTEADTRGWTAVPRGEVISIGVREDSAGQELMKTAQKWSKATVRLYSPEGVKRGDQLFVVNTRNLVIARIDVKSVFQSESFGTMLTGTGNFASAKNGFLVVQKVDDNYSRYAYIYKARGDYFKGNGDTGKAIELYKKSLEMDKRYPEAHLALGYVYMREDMMSFASKEFGEAYKEIDRMYDNEDKYQLLKGLATTRYRMAYEYPVSNSVRATLVREGIRYADEALKIYPDSRDANLYLGMFYYKGPESQDVKAKQQFLRVIEIDPMNVRAYLALAELYRRHDNGGKALEYARKALEVSPDSVEAKRLLNRLQ